MDQHKVFTEPTDDELILAGELLKIEVHHTSFTVHFQTCIWLKASIPASLLVHTVTYPIKALNRFFYINRKYSLVDRREAVWSNQELTSGKRKRNYRVKF